MYNDCNICESSDKELESYVKTLPYETSFHRVSPQEVKCGFGLQGICCRLCSNGPCRIMEDRPRGVCGADAADCRQNGSWCDAPGTILNFI